MKSGKPKTRRPRTGKTAGTRSLRPASAEAARLRVVRRRRPLAKTGQEAVAPEQAAEAVRDDAVIAANSNEGAGANPAGNSEVPSAAEVASRGSESEGTGRDDPAAGKSAAKHRLSENTAAHDAAPETGSAGAADPDEGEGGRPKQNRASRRQTAKAALSEAEGGANATAGIDQGSGTSSGRKGRGRGRKQLEEKTEPAKAKARAEKSQAGGKNLADQPGQTDKPQQMLGRSRRSKAPVAAPTEPAKAAEDRPLSAPKPGLGAAIAQEGSSRDAVGGTGSTGNAAPPAVADRGGESRAPVRYPSSNLEASSEASILMRDALALGAEAMRAVASARTLPEAFEAQMRFGRAAAEIWMRQVHLASSLLGPSLGSWWMSPDVMGARLPE